MVREKSLSFQKSKNKKNIFTINKKYFQTNLLKLFEK